MPDGPFLTPDEHRFMRLISESGSPQAAGRNLIARLEALEQAVAALEASADTDAAAADPVPEAAPKAE